MALNPNILLGFTPQDNTQTFNIFNSALNQAQSRRIQQQEADQRAALFPTQQQQVEQQAALGALQLQGARNKSRVLDVATFSQQLKPQLEADIASGNFDRSKTILTRRLAELQRRQAAGENVDTTETAEALQLLEAGRAEDVLLGANTFIGLAQSQGLIGGQQAGRTAAQREFAELTEGLTEAEREQARRIRLGLSPRAVGSAAQTITGTGEAEQVAETEKILAEAGEAGKLEAKIKLQPEIERNVKDAVAASAAEAKISEEERTNQKALNVYNAGISKLTEALGATETGPFAGRLPSVTANQQIADGAVAAMAPILKQMFRSAGEGTFTDQDQKLLLDMIPTRIDRPEAIKAKLENIDSIVRAKLGQQQAQAPTQVPVQQPAQQQVLRFDAQGNPIQ